MKPVKFMIKPSIYSILCRIYLVRFDRQYRSKLIVTLVLAILKYSQIDIKF